MFNLFSVRVPDPFNLDPTVDVLFNGAVGEIEELLSERRLFSRWRRRPPAFGSVRTRRENVCLESVLHRSLAHV